MSNIAFIGTGVMGAPMAGHLVTAGHKVTVYNRSRDKAEAWAAKYGGTVAARRRARMRSSLVSAMTMIWRQ